MAFGRKTGGRRKGTPNKLTDAKRAAVRDAMEAAFDGMGGVGRLTEWAKGNPGEFYRLWARLLPVQVNAQVAGRLTLEQLVAGDEEGGG